MSREAKLYLNCVIAAGGIMLVDGLGPWQLSDVGQFLAYLVLAALAATLRFRLPGMQGAYSLGFVFILVGFVNLSLPQTMLIGCTVVLVHVLWRPATKPIVIRVLFNVSAAAIGVVSAYDLSHQPAIVASGSIFCTVLVSAVIYFVINTALVAGAIAMVQNTPFQKVLRRWLSWAAPYYIVRATAAGLTSYLSRSIDWRAALIVLAPVFFLHGYYRRTVEQQSWTIQPLIEGLVLEDSAPPFPVRIP